MLVKKIYLFQAGAPSQIDLFDYKPYLEKVAGQNLPDEVRMGQRITGMTVNQKSLPLTPSLFKFAQYGQSGAWLSDKLPYTSKIVDELCIVKSMHTEQINHDPAITFFQTGFQLGNRPSIGSWISYGIGSENKDLPAFCVMTSKTKGGNFQGLYNKLWSNGFLDATHQGVLLNGGVDPILYLNNPKGYDRDQRREMLDLVKDFNQTEHNQINDPEILAKIEQYELAYRMQMSVPEATSMKDESESTFELYGPDSKIPGTYAYNCLMARKLSEKGVRFIQLYHQGWDAHAFLQSSTINCTKDTDQASAALITDLKQRGLLDDTLVIWGGEFGRTVYGQGPTNLAVIGRDHHPKCFTMWMAGGGIKPGMVYGETDDYGYNITKDPVHVHDFQATLLHLLGINHEELTFTTQGRRFRLTDVGGKVVKNIIK
ncbi:MAG: sulfatase [Flavobacteriaceae bacterium]|nr:MAG: sulfatase [Flavobacteriaceae bacterium]